MGRPSGRTKEETRARIIESALLCFGRYGYGGASNRMIADGAGVTTGALYRHFSTKADIYLSTFLEINGWMRERVTTAVSGTSSLRETMLAVARVSGALRAEKPQITRSCEIMNISLVRYRKTTYFLCDALIAATFSFFSAIRLAISALECKLSNMGRVTKRNILVFCFLLPLMLDPANLESAEMAPALETNRRNQSLDFRASRV